MAEAYHYFTPEEIRVTLVNNPMHLIIPEGFKAVLVPSDTPLFCADCHDLEAPEYRLRRRGGKYVALCYRPGTIDGCWNHDQKPICDYTDHEGVQCTYVAEWGISINGLIQSMRCVAHVGPALTDVSEHRVFPL